MEQHVGNVSLSYSVHLCRKDMVRINNGSQFDLIRIIPHQSF